MKYTDIKKECERKYTELSDKVGLFWAFSNEQFAEGKAKNPVAEGEKYTSIGAGGYLPSKNVQEFIDGQKEIEAWRKAEVKKDRAEATKTILYELNNYECFYTGEIEPALEVLLPLGFSRKQVVKVYHDNREFALN